MGTVSIGAGVSIVGSGGSNIDFTTVVPFSRSGSMGTYFVSGPVEFTPSSAGAVAGASVFARVVADGINMPTFSGGSYGVGIQKTGTISGQSNRGNTVPSHCGEKSLLFTSCGTKVR